MCEDVGHWFPDTKSWTVVSDSAVSWRDSPNYDDKVVGKGPEPGDRVESYSIVEGSGPGSKEFWFVKGMISPGVFGFLPVNSASLRPFLRPSCSVPSWSKTETWEVVYPGGVGVRKSANYDDKDVGDDGGYAVVLDQGTVFTGRALEGVPSPGESSQDVPQMIKVEDRFAPNGVMSTLYVPLMTRDGRDVCEKRETPSGGAPPPGPPPPTYPGAPPTAYPGGPPPPSGFAPPPYTGPPASGYGGYAPPPPAPPPPAPAPPPPPAPPKPEWEQFESGGKPYWHNNRTGETTWTNPFAAPPPPAPPAPPKPEWSKLSSGGKPYWHNNRTGETTWKDPFAPPPPPAPPAPPAHGYNRSEFEPKHRIRHCRDLDWRELMDHEQRAAQVLGYDRYKWDNEKQTKATKKSWRRLTHSEREAAKTLGETEYSWNEDDSSSDY